MRGEKNPLFMKEAKEEALHFGWRKGDDDIVVNFSLKQITIYSLFCMSLK